MIEGRVYFFCLFGGGRFFVLELSFPDCDSFLLVDRGSLRIEMV